MFSLQDKVRLAPPGSFWFSIRSCWLLLVQVTVTALPLPPQPLLLIQPQLLLVVALVDKAQVLHAGRVQHVVEGESV